MNTIDLRSDTVTQPTPEMRAAMAEAVVGDDVYGEDPTVNRLQDMAAQMMGKQAALFVPSGTMGNLASILAHCNRGDEVILGNQAHTFNLEAAGITALGGIQAYQIPNQPDGSLDLDDIKDAIRGDDPHYPTSTLIALENTHNRCGGNALPVEYVRRVGQVARENNLRLHIDGARIFNAAVSLGVNAAELVAPADSVTFCLSKGLSAPVGSLVCGSEKFIARVQRMRKQLGGGMRQAGILAAAGIVALEKMVDRLSEDHRRAHELAENLQQVPGISLELGLPKTNIVFLSLSPEVPLNAFQIGTQLERRGIKVQVKGASSFRLVTHYWISDQDVEKTIGVFREVIGGH